MAGKYTKKEISIAAQKLQNPHTPEKKESEFARILAWARWHKRKSS
ncbi:hypothetical protein M1146_01830 [Patescibacteria group bacterium]|nr:hypothetical protein [Patescibacteria group bacterium]